VFAGRIVSVLTTREAFGRERNDYLTLRRPPGQAGGVCARPSLTARRDVGRGSVLWNSNVLEAECSKDRGLIERNGLFKEELSEQNWNSTTGSGHGPRRRTVRSVGLCGLPGFVAWRFSYFLRMCWGEPLLHRNSSRIQVPVESDHADRHPGPEHPPGWLAKTSGRPRDVGR